MKMGTNELLFWMSARGEGSWGQFRSAVEKLVETELDESSGGRAGLPVHQALRFGLQRLGHAEFDVSGCEGGWRVAPPVIALVQQPTRTVGFLCGARLPKMLEVFHGAARDLSVEVTTGLNQPDAIRVVAPDKASLVDLGSRAGISVQYDAPAFTLACLPTIDHWPRLYDARLPFGHDWEVSRFEIQRRSFRWIPVSVQEASQSREGLFRFTRFQIPTYYLRSNARTFGIEGAVAKFLLLAERRRSVVRYDPATRSLSVPDICRPPLLVDRALALCSGFLPHYEERARLLVYRDVGEGVAGLAANILRQRL